MKRPKQIRVPRSSPGRKDPVKVSNHALFRWLERSGAVDIESLRATLSAALDRAYQAGAAMHQGDFLILAGGNVFVIREDTVVTVLDEDDQHHAERARARALDRRMAEDNAG